MNRTHTVSMEDRRAAPLQTALSIPHGRPKITLHSRVFCCVVQAILAVSKEAIDEGKNFS